MATTFAGTCTSLFGSTSIFTMKELWWDMLFNAIWSICKTGDSLAANPHCSIDEGTTSGKKNIAEPCQTNQQTDTPSWFSYIVGPRFGQLSKGLGPSNRGPPQGRQWVFNPIISSNPLCNRGEGAWVSLPWSAQATAGSFPVVGRLSLSLPACHWITSADGVLDDGQSMLFSSLQSRVSTSDVCHLWYPYLTWSVSFVEPWVKSEEISSFPDKGTAEIARLSWDR